MAAASRTSDKRHLSGQRVIGRCEVIADTANPYAWNPVRCGYIVLNVRGGCLYLSERCDANDVAMLFPHDGQGTFVSLTVAIDDDRDLVMENVNVAFRRINRHADRDGIVFTFLDVSEQQLDALQELTATLPPIGRKEEASVPFDKVISLNRSDRLILL